MEANVDKLVRATFGREVIVVATVLPSILQGCSARRSDVWWVRASDTCGDSGNNGGRNAGCAQSGMKEFL